MNCLVVIFSSLKDMNFGIWGLSFKPGTDDMRRSPSIQIINSIITNGGKINAYDPKAIKQAMFYLKDLKINYFEINSF